MRRTIVLGGLALACIVADAARAAAQQQTRVETSAVVSHFDVAAAAPNTERSSELFANLQTLRRYQERYYAQHGRFAASGSEIPEFRPMPGASIFVTTGGDWAVINAQVEGVASYTLTMWVKDTPQPIVSGSFGPPPVAFRAGRPDGTPRPQ